MVTLVSNFGTNGKLIRHTEGQEKKQKGTVGSQGQEELPGLERAGQGNRREQLGRRMSYELKTSNFIHSVRLNQRTWGLGSIHMKRWYSGSEVSSGYHIGGCLAHFTNSTS